MALVGGLKAVLADSALQDGHARPDVLDRLRARARSNDQTILVTLSEETLVTQGVAVPELLRPADIMLA